MLQPGGVLSAISGATFTLGKGQTLPLAALAGAERTSPAISTSPVWLNFQNSGGSMAEITAASGTFGLGGGTLNYIVVLAVGKQ